MNGITYNITYEYTRSENDDNNMQSIANFEILYFKLSETEIQKLNLQT